MATMVPSGPARTLLAPLLRTGGRLLAHLVFLLTGLLGDDWLGRWLRFHLLRASGARLEPGASLHGGTYLSRPDRLVVGAGSFLNRNCYLDLEAPVVIGRNVTVGHGTTFVTTEHDLGPSGRRCGAGVGRPIEVGDGAWLGANVTVLPGVTIGAGAVVAAGALVRADVPPDCLVAGVPARPVRMLASNHAADLADAASS